MGQENAARAVGRILNEGAFDLVVSSGLAGGLRPGYRSGSILVSRAVRCLDDGREIEASTEWVRRARELGAEEAVFATSSRVVGTSDAKRSLGAEADAVEMESFAVIEEAKTRGIAAVAIRAISDPVEAGMPIDFSRVFDDKGRMRATSFAAQLIRNPGALTGLVRLARDSRRASVALAKFLDRYLAAAAQAGALQA